MKKQTNVGVTLIILSVVSFIMSLVFSYYYRYNYPGLTEFQYLINNKKSFYAAVVSCVLLFLGLGTHTYKKKTKK